MNMDGQLRVFTELKHRELYVNLKALGVVSDFHDLFFVCASLGFSRDLRQPFVRKDERFWSRTITPAEWACYYAMILSRHGYNIATIKDDKIVLAEVEEFANAGMRVLIDEFLNDYLVPAKKDSELQIAAASSRELPKEFLQFVFLQGEQEGQN